MLRRIFIQRSEKGRSCVPQKRKKRKVMKIKAVTYPILLVMLITLTEEVVLCFDKAAS